MEQVTRVSSFLKDASVETLHPVSTAYPNFALLLVNISRKLQNVLRRVKVQYTVIDLKSLLTMEMRANRIAKSRILNRSTTSCWSSIIGYFARYDEINAWMDSIEKCDSLVSIQSIGESYEGRDIRVLKISARKQCETAIVIVAGVHGREWLAVATAVYLIEKIIEKYRDGDEAAHRLLNSFDIYFVPMLNPDGYEFTFTKDRFWRKTRQPWNGTMGTDLNRNFDIDFLGPGSSPSSADSEYRGPFPFSEPEAANFRDFILSIRRKVKMFVDMHAYGMLWLVPSDLAGMQSVDEAEVRRVAQIGAKGIYNVNKGNFSVGKCNELLYNVSGTSFDWIHYVAKVKYSYSLELRPKSTFVAFLAPPASIRASGEEVYAGIVAVAKEIANT